MPDSIHGLAPANDETLLAGTAFADDHAIDKGTVVSLAGEILGTRNPKPVVFRLGSERKASGYGRSPLSFARTLRPKDTASNFGTTKRKTALRGQGLTAVSIYWGVEGSRFIDQ